MDDRYTKAFWRSLNLEMKIRAIATLILIAASVATNLLTIETFPEGLASVFLLLIAYVALAEVIGGAYANWFGPVDHSLLGTLVEYGMTRYPIVFWVFTVFVVLSFIGAFSDHWFGIGGLFDETG
jgi:hypothetical protein